MTTTVLKHLKKKILLLNAELFRESRDYQQS